MGKKATLVTKIAGLTDGGLNTAAEVRALLTEFLDDVFTTPVFDNLTTQTNIVTTALPGGTSGTLTANICFRQIGGQIRIDLIINNATSSALNGFNLFSFKPDAGGYINNFMPSDIEDPATGLPKISTQRGFNGTSTIAQFAIGWISGTPVLKCYGQLPFGITTLDMIYDQKQ